MRYKIIHELMPNAIDANVTNNERQCKNIFFFDSIPIYCAMFATTFRIQIMRNKSLTDWKQLVFFIFYCHWIYRSVVTWKYSTEFTHIGHWNGLRGGKDLFFFLVFFFLNVVWENCSVVDCNMAIIDCPKFDRNFAMVKKQKK